MILMQNFHDAYLYSAIPFEIRSSLDVLWWYSPPRLLVSWFGSSSLAYIRNLTHIKTL